MKSTYIVLLTVLHLIFISPLKAQSGKEMAPAKTPQAQKWWNLLYYTVNIIPDYDEKFITGTSRMEFSVLDAGSVMQIDLYEPMRITAVTWNDQAISCKKENGRYYLISFPRELKKR